MASIIKISYESFKRRISMKDSTREYLLKGSREIRAWIPVVTSVFLTLAILQGWGVLGQVRDEIKDLGTEIKNIATDTAAIMVTSGISLSPWTRIYTLALDEADTKKYIELHAGKYVIADSWKLKKRLISEAREEEIEGILQTTDYPNIPPQETVAIVYSQLGGSRWSSQLEIPGLSPYGKIGILSAYINEINIKNQLF